MPSPFRSGSFLERTWTAVLGREERAATPAPFISAFAGLSGIQHQFKPLESLDYYGDNPWLYGAVNVIAQEFSRVKLFLFKERKDGEIEKIYDHQALATINKPMPIKTGRSILTHMQLKYLLAQHYLLNGEAFWLLDGRIKVSGAPTVIHPLLPAFVLEKLDEEFNIKEYWYRAAGKQMALDPMDVIHFKLPDPKMWYRGHSPVKSARYALDSHKEADVHNYRNFINGATPGGVLSTEAKISPEEQKRIVDQFNQKYAGSSNAGKIVALPQGLKYQRVQETNAEMQYSELKTTARDEILANFRVGIEMLGKTEGQTRANADAANYVFQRFTVLPMVEFIVDVLNNDYLPAFPGTEDLKFGFEEFVPEDVLEKRENIKLLSDNAAMPPDEMRQEFGYEPLDVKGVTDIPYISYSKIPADMAATVAQPPEKDFPEDGSPEEEVSGSKKKAPERRALEDEEEEDYPEVEEIFDKNRETDIFAALAVPFLLLAFRSGVDIANQDGRGEAVPVEDVFTKNVRKAIEEKSLLMSAKAMDTMEEDLRRLLDQAVADKVGTQELARRINKLYGESMGYRSLRIARTELTGSINDGALRTYAEKGYEAKQWSTVMDGNERDSHHAANGQVASIDDYFLLAGGPALFPGDPSLPPEELINCRCRVQPAEFSDEGSGEANPDWVKKKMRATSAQFLRVHGHLERQYIVALEKQLAKQRDRILSNFPPIA